MNNPTIAQVKRAVMDVFGITRDQLESKSRTQKVVRPRHIAIHMCLLRTPRSTTQIGLSFGHNDHTTVLYVKRKMPKWTARDARLVEEIASVSQRLDEIMGAGDAASA